MELYFFIRLLLSTVSVIAAVQAQNEFSVLPSNITGRISFPARFDCQPSSPDGFVRWAIGSDFLMLNNDSCPGCQRLINNSLYIPAVNQGHEGAYTCFLFNVGGGLPRFTVYLTIAEDPEIETPANNILVNEGDTLQVNVNVTGVPQPILGKGRSIDGRWGPFGSWSSCSKTCGGGIRTRQRECNNPPPSNGGVDCVGRTTRKRGCKKNACPVNGEWSRWTRWSTCSQTCGDGVRTRYRACNNPPPSNGGKDCKGKTVRQRSCNRKACPSEWSLWMSWSSCSATCGGGQRTRQRFCMNSVGNDSCSGTAEKTEICNSFNCPVNGGWSSWTNWTSCFVKCYQSSCSQICGGQRIRQRFCNSPLPWQGGNDCFGNSSQQQACNVTDSLTDKPRFKDESSEDQRQAICYFDMGQVSGSINLLQYRYNSTKLYITIDGLRNLPGNEYGLDVTEYPANLNQLNPCATASVGDVYNPEGVNTSLPGYPARCKENHKQCAIGDLSSRHSSLTHNDSGVLVELTDGNLNLYESNTVVGRAMTLKRLDTGTTLSCCNIEVPTNTRILQTRFDGNMFDGEINIVQLQYDTINYTRIENIIMVDLKRTDGGPADLVLGWQLQHGVTDKTCSHLGPVLGQQPEMAGDSVESCSQKQHCTCRLGDLTSKCGPLQLVNNRIRAQCIDNQLILRHSTLNQLVVSIIDQSNVTVQCGQLNEQFPIEAYVNFHFNGGFVNLRFSQSSPFRFTKYRTYVVGLDGQAGNIVVYDGEDCSNLGNILDYPGRLPVANPSTSDRYPVGELGPKIGGVVGRNYLRGEGMSSNIPLTGPVNILNKAIALLSKEGYVLGCGLVKMVPY